MNIPIDLDEVYGVPIEDLNPDIKLLGPGPAGCRCGSCGNLWATRIPTCPRNDRTGDADEQTIYYCLINGQSKRVTWPACSRYVEA